MLAVITVSTVTAIATMAELMYQRPRSLALNTAEKAENVKCGTLQVAGTMIVSFSALTEVSTAHAIGTSQSRASAMTTPVTARLNRFERQSCRARAARAGVERPRSVDRGRGTETAMVRLPS